MKNNNQSKEKSYYESELSLSIEKHLKEYPDFPITLRLGDSRFFSFSLESLRALNTVYEEYKDKLYDVNSNKLDLINNPNIKTISKHTNKLKSETIDLNNLLINSAINIIKESKQYNNDVLVFYKPLPNRFKNQKLDKPIVDFLIEPVQVNIFNQIKKLKQNSYFLLTQDNPLRKNASDEFKYLYLINLFKNSEILNPYLKYHYLKNNLVFDKLPKQFDLIFSKETTPKNTHNKTIKKITSSLPKIHTRSKIK
jgi:hypothetical protein